MPKTSLLSQVVNAKDELSNSKFVTKSEDDFELDEEVDLFSRILVSDADQKWRQQKKEVKANQTNTKKLAKLLNKIFNYIYIARC